jgi:hypothetical protein
MTDPTDPATMQHGERAPDERELCELDNGLRGCCGTAQLGPHRDGCPKPAALQDAMLAHEQMFRHATEAHGWLT